MYFQSGRINRVEYHPYFKERYEQLHTEYYSCGKDSTCTRTYYTTEYLEHPEYWLAIDSLGQAKEIIEGYYNIISKDFGNKLIIDNSRIRFEEGGECVEGDPNLYYYINTTDTYNYPTNRIARWSNPIKRTNSIFFNSEKEFIPYAQAYDWESTNRQRAKTDIPQKEWEIFNTKLYEIVGVNVILVQLNKPSELQELKSSWNSGKKNDIVISFIGDYKAPTEVKVFGWYDTEILSSTLEEYILTHGIKHENLQEIKNIILRYYAPFDFNKFSYLKYTNPSIGVYIGTCIFIFLAIGVGVLQLLCNDDRRY